MASWQKYFESDDAFEESERQHLEKIDSLESIIRLFEVKMKNAQDHSKFLFFDDSELYWCMHCLFWPAVNFFALFF